MYESSSTVAQTGRFGASFLTLAAGAAVLVAAASASASPLDPFIVVSASNGSGTGSVTVPLAATTLLPNGSRVYQQVGSVNIMDGANVVATINGLFGLVRPQQSPTLGHGINVTFDLIAGSSSTTFTIDSALFDIPPDPTAAARVSGNVGVTDSNSNGVSLSGLNAGGFAYRSAYNGAAPGGSQFAAFFSTVADPNPGGSQSASDAFPGGGLYNPIGAASNMSVRWNFSLTAGDQAAGGGIFEIIPAPGAAALFGLAGLGMLRRSRR